ncbi:MAG: hypothetical protein ACRCV3_06205 [Desulfovibrionaceae bacterium]
MVLNSKIIMTIVIVAICVLGSFYFIISDFTSRENEVIEEMEENFPKQEDSLLEKSTEVQN